jgi:protein-S-isoprenylcysteine O-methyltransferase Ste14
MELELPSPTLPSILLVLTILLSTYITIRCMTPPNPSPTSSQQPKDRVQLATNTIFLSLRRNATILLAIHHTVLTLYLSRPTPPPAVLCPSQTHLVPALFTWSPTTILLLLTILTAGPLRLRAYSTLGPSFTFRITAPEKLVTTGLYAWVQHPSYTCQILVVGANAFLLEGRGGVLGCWVGLVGEQWVSFLGGVAWLAVGVAFAGVVVRVRDEEALLRGTFGEEWEVWHRKTKRFVPGVF